GTVERPFGGRLGRGLRGCTLGIGSRLRHLPGIERLVPVFLVGPAENGGLAIVVTHVTPIPSRLLSSRYRGESTKAIRRRARSSWAAMAGTRDSGAPSASTS